MIAPFETNHEKPTAFPHDNQAKVIRDVLVAEDNVVNQMVIKAMLEKVGCSVRLASDGQRAVDAYAEKTPDSVLMDSSMPVVDGVAATSEIRTLQGLDGRRIPIIGVTAHALREDRKRCIEAGMDDYISKPISPDRLKDKLLRWRGDLLSASAG